eukprot:5569266-Amphidinium_carterae.1
MDPTCAVAKQVEVCEQLHACKAHVQLEGDLDQGVQEQLEKAIGLVLKGSADQALTAMLECCKAWHTEVSSDCQRMISFVDVAWKIALCVENMTAFPLLKDKWDDEQTFKFASEGFLDMQAFTRTLKELHSLKAALEDTSFVCQAAFTKLDGMIKGSYIIQVNKKIAECKVVAPKVVEKSINESPCPRCRGCALAKCGMSKALTRALRSCWQLPNVACWPWTAAK